MDDVRTGKELCGRQYVRTLNDLLLVQCDIAKEVSQRLHAGLSAAEQQRLSLVLRSMPRLTRPTSIEPWAGLGHAYGVSGNRAGAPRGLDHLSELSTRSGTGSGCLEKIACVRMHAAHSMIVRSADAGDTSAITAIYGHHVLGGLGTFEEAPPDETEMAARLAAVQSKGLPCLVAAQNDVVLGFAYAAPFRLRSAYRFTAEDSVYVAPHAIGRGVGRALLAKIIEDCENYGLRQLTAVIGDRDNSASIGLHSALGFEHRGSFRSVGYKHGRWLDIVFMQKSLNGGDEEPPSRPGIRL